MPISSSLELLNTMVSSQLALPHLDVGGGNIDIIHGICLILNEFNFSAILASTPSSMKAIMVMNTL